MNRARKPNESYGDYREALEVKEHSRDRKLYAATRIMLVPSKLTPGVLENRAVTRGPSRRMGDGSYVQNL